MIVISNFYKLILIIILIIILFELVKNVNTETFQAGSTPICDKEDPQTCPFDYIIKKIEDQDKHPEDIGKNLIELEWNNNTNNNNLIFNKFIIVIFINNRGPFFDAVRSTVNIYKCPLALKKGVKYKFGVIGIYTQGEKIDELITGLSIKEITVDALNNNYNQTKLNNWIQKVSCKSNGRHNIISKEKCGQQTYDNSIIAKHSTSTDIWFSDEKHNELMKALTNKSPSKLNVNLSHNLPTK